MYVFSATRHKFTGKIYRSVKPYAIDEFEEVFDGYIAYPQPWFVPGKGFFLFCTVYHSVQRVPRWRYSADGRTWSDKQTIVKNSHYQITEGKGDRLISVYNLHPGGVDKRTNLYFVETRDFGETWQNIHGETVKLPLENDDSSTLIYDARSNGDLVYLKDVVFNNEDHPTILYLLSKNSKPGPRKEEPSRSWNIARWTGSEWQHHRITTGFHNYDQGSLYVEEDGTYRVIAPTERGPQEWGTGGEVAVWTSNDQGATWSKIDQLTTGSTGNHSYVRRPHLAHPDFYAFWAAGDSVKQSKTQLHFATKDGAVYQLPDPMTEDYQKPILVREAPEK